MRIAELNSRNLFEFLQDNNAFTYNRLESYSGYEKFRIQKGESIVVFFSARANKWKWFYQYDSSEKFDIYDGIKLGLWLEEDISVMCASNYIPVSTVEQVAKNKFNPTELLDFEQTLYMISTYKYRCLWFGMKNLFKNSHGAMVVPAFLFSKGSFVIAGYVLKHHSGFKKYIGNRGLVISKSGVPKRILFAESILDAFAFLQIKDIKNEDIILVATHGNISQDQIITLKALLTFYKLDVVETLFDNDKAGDSYRSQFDKFDFSSIHHKSISKDFLDDFCSAGALQ